MHNFTKIVFRFVLSIIFFGLALSADAQQTFIVDRTADDGTINACDSAVSNDCSLRDAIRLSNASVGTLDTINFDQSTLLFGNGGTISILLGDLIISDSVIIEQTGSIAPVTIDADGNSRFFTVNAGINVTLTRLKLTNGNGGSEGGAILNSGNLSINQSNITANTASQGGGIYNNGGTLTINRSTLSLNTAGSGGGGIYNFNGTIATTALVTLTNSTLSGNSGGGGFGGGYFGFSNLGTTSLSANNATIAGNFATFGGGIAVTSTTGQTSNANIDNTIVGDNMAGNAGPDVFDNSSQVVPAGLPIGTVVVAGNITSSGYNIIENTSGASIMLQPCNTNLLQTCDQFVDPRLLALDNNGFIFAPTQGLDTSSSNLSPAIDKGDSALTEDQRGQSRPVDFMIATQATGGNNTDIGAFEVQNPLAPTAALVTIGGRVLSSFSRGIARARVSITDSNGATRYAMTNNFGYFRFNEIAVGETYTFNVSAKRYRFSPQMLTVNEVTNNLNFRVEQ